MKLDTNSNPIHFAVVATDVVCFRVIDGKLHTLVAKAPSHSPFPGEWALLGGMVRSRETVEDTASRILKDKAGVENIFIDQVHTFSAVDRDPRGRVVSIAYLALTYLDPQDISKAQLETKWFDTECLPKLAYDHDEIFKYTLSHLRFKIQNTDFARHLLAGEFTLSELQSTYEAVLGERLDKRNFRKKVLASDMLKGTKRTKKKGVMRPAALFNFK